LELPWSPSARDDAKPYTNAKDGAALMEFRVLDRDKNAIKLEIDGSDDTVIYPLINELLKDEDVSEAKYSVGHPDLDKPVLYVRTKKGKPQSAIKKASDNLMGQFREARKLFEAQLK
jgi:DNA-directed RNA polymerase subunit L